MVDLDGIDSAIVDQIREFNRLGLETFTSCAGHPWAPADYPYISFTHWNDTFAEVARWVGFDVQDNRNGNAEWKMAIFHKTPADTCGFVSKLNALVAHCRAISLAQKS